jgi:hypothetical protein
MFSAMSGNRALTTASDDASKVTVRWEREPSAADIAEFYAALGFEVEDEDRKTLAGGGWITSNSRASNSEA